MSGRIRKENDKMEWERKEKQTNKTCSPFVKEGYDPKWKTCAAV